LSGGFNGVPAERRARYSVSLCWGGHLFRWMDRSCSLEGQKSNGRTEVRPSKEKLQYYQFVPMMLANKQPNNQTTKQPNNQTTKQPNNQTTKQTNKQTSKQTNKQTSKQANKQTSKQANNSCRAVFGLFVRCLVCCFGCCCLVLCLVLCLFFVCFCQLLVV
jgi:hypothetical protein